ncbi:MAG: hypothetical protein JNL19_00950 [Burkholderiales bacterium]|nr:hypothetical protein [Burkholderiales bacterium]
MTAHHSGDGEAACFVQPNTAFGIERLADGALRGENVEVDTVDICHQTAIWMPGIQKSYIDGAGARCAAGAVTQRPKLRRHPAKTTPMMLRSNPVRVPTPFC